MEKKNVKSKPRPSLQNSKPVLAVPYAFSGADLELRAGPVAIPQIALVPRKNPGLSRLTPGKLTTIC
jgi:hypothetical protein